MNKDVLFGGIPVVIAGDFRQTLPIVPRGTSADQLKACLKKSYLWNSAKTLTLRINMRAKLSGNSDTAKFAAQLLKIGNGLIPYVDNDSNIQVPQDIGVQVHWITFEFVAFLPSYLYPPKFSLDANILFHVHEGHISAQKGPLLTRTIIQDVVGNR